MSQIAHGQQCTRASCTARSRPQRISAGDRLVVPVIDSVTSPSVYNIWDKIEKSSVSSLFFPSSLNSDAPGAKLGPAP